MTENRFDRFRRKHPIFAPIYVSIVGVILIGGVLSGIITNIITQELGTNRALTLIIFIIAIFVLFYPIEVIFSSLNEEKKRRVLIEANPKSEPLIEQYKGLIASVSLISATHLFRWDSVPGSDNKKLLRFLEDDLGVPFVENRKIEKSDDGKILKIFNNENGVNKTLAEISVKKENGKVTLKIGKKIYSDLIIAKIENGCINVYKDNKARIKSTIEKGKSINDANGLEGVLKELYRERGIGPTFRAVKHHLGKLERCWLLCTRDVNDGVELVRYFTEIFGIGTVEIITKAIDDPSNIEGVHKVITDIYTNEIDGYCFNETDIIADITGGTVIMSVAIVLACISNRRDMEYLEQKNYNLQKIDENIHEIMFDQ